MSSLQVDNINPYLSSSVNIVGGLNTENLEIRNFEYPSQGYFVFKPREGNSYPSLGMENNDDNLDIYSYDLTGSLSLSNSFGFKVRTQYQGDPTQYHELEFDRDGVLRYPSSVIGATDTFAIEATSGIHQYQPDTITITDSTGSFDARNGNFFKTTLDADVDNRFEFSNIGGGQTINILVNTAGTATVSFDTSVVKQPDGFSYTPTNGTAKDILTFINFDNTALYLVAVKNLV
jgi:hypothetical protein